MASGQIVHFKPCALHIMQILFRSTFFSSSELKAQVSFFDHNLSVVLIHCWPCCLCCHCCWNFSHFCLLLQNQLANFNWTLNTKYKWNVKGFQIIQSEGPHPFPRWYNNEIVKIHWWNLKIFFSRTNQTWHKASLGDGGSSVSKRR